MPDGIVVIDVDDDIKFANRLLQLVNKYGWSGDYIEVAKFVDWVYDQFGLPIPPADQFEPE